MPEQACRSSGGLLGPTDPPAFEMVNAGGRRPLVLVCDHASPLVPHSLGDLGLGDEVFSRHVAYDIGAAAVARNLARRLDAPAVLSGYSRLVIDCNRAPGDPGSIPEESDGIVIPANRDLTEAAAMVRVDQLFRPYHGAVTDAIAHLWRTSGLPPAVFSIHSFTPRLIGSEHRPWDAGVLWNRDPRLAVPLINVLRGRPGLTVGDNQPYSGKEIAYTIDRHAGAAGLPNCAIEIRQDHLATADGITRWSAILGEALEEILAISGLHQVDHH